MVDAPSRDAGGCAALDPVEDVRGVKAPAPNAETLRSEQAAQVGAADRLFVTPDERGDLDSR
jgi:hypothetical protein